MNQKKFSLLSVIGSYSISFLLSFILLLLLDALVGVINVASDTPSEPINVHLITRVLKEDVLLVPQVLWVWRLGIFMVGFIITYLASRSVLLSKVFLGLVSGAAIIFSIFLYLFFFRRALWLVGGAAVLKHYFVRRGVVDYCWSFCHCPNFALEHLGKNRKFT
jgi:hypothetical protein